MCPRKRSRPARTPLVESTNTLSPTFKPPDFGGVSIVVVVVVTVVSDLLDWSHIRSRKETRPVGESIRDEVDEYDRVGDPSRCKLAEEAVDDRYFSGDLDLDRKMPQVGECCNLLVGDGDRETGEGVLGDVGDRYSEGTSGYRVSRQSRENIPRFGGQ